MIDALQYDSSRSTSSRSEKDLLFQIMIVMIQKTHPQIWIPFASTVTVTVSIDLQKRKLKKLIEYNATYATIGSMNFV